MFTTFIIIMIIVMIYAAKEDAKKKEVIDKVDHNERRTKLNKVPDTRIQLKALSGFGKVLSLDFSEDNFLTLFSYAGGNVFLKFQSGKTYTLNIEQMNVYFTFYPAVNHRCAEIKIGPNVINIQENELSTSTQDWDRIFDILALSGTTHQVDCLSLESRQRAIAWHRQQQRQQQMQRNFQRMQQNNWNMMNRF